MMATGVTSLKPEDPVREAIKAASVSGALELPVVDADGVLVGMVAVERLIEAAFTLKLASGALNGDGPAPGRAGRPANRALTPVSALMDAGFKSVTPEAPAREVAGHFFANGLKSLPVVDNQKRLLGVITPKEVILRLCKYMEKGF